MSNIIEVRDLCFSYNDREFIKNMSFEIEKGSYTCIVGPNGSGKTTLIRLLCGLLEKKEGSILIDDVLLDDENVGSIRRKVGVVFQNPDCHYVGTTLRDDIVFGLENHNVDPREMDCIVDEISKLCGVYDLLDKEPYSMSGGQKQKGAIAGILAFNPNVLILDEATSMLDPVSKKDFKETVLRLKEEKNLTIISITHDMDDTLSADKVIVLNKGKIVFDGTNKELYKKDLSSYKLQLPSIIQIQKCLNYKKFILDKELFFCSLEGDNNEN